MIKYITQDSYWTYQIDLECGSFSVVVNGSMSRMKVDRLITEAEVGGFSAENVLRCLEIALIIRRRDPVVAIRWFMRECGGLGNLQAWIQTLIKSQDYSTASKVLGKLEKVKELFGCLSESEK